MLYKFQTFNYSVPLLLLPAKGVMGDVNKEVCLGRLAWPRGRAGLACGCCDWLAGWRPRLPTCSNTSVCVSVGSIGACVGQSERAAVTALSLFAVGSCRSLVVCCAPALVDSSITFAAFSCPACAAPQSFVDN